MTDALAALGAMFAVLVAFYGLRRATLTADVARSIGRLGAGRQVLPRASVGKRPRRVLLAGIAERMGSTRLGGRLAAHAERVHPARSFSDMLAIWISGAVGGGLAAGVLFRSTPLVVALTFAGPLIADRLMIRLGGRRTARLEQQLPEAFAKQASALRAGHSTSASIRMLSIEMPSPLGDELAAIVREMDLGRGLDHCLARLAERVGSRDVNLWVTAVTVHNQTGGNLSKMLESLSANIRERVQMRAEIRALTAQGRLSGLVVALAPLGFFLLLSATSREQMKVLYTTRIGLVILALGVVMQFAGFLWIRHIMRIKT